ncbi:MAG TPA: hypothetical protein VEX13_15810 [Chloroflexia bacterium]|nr:hypothetical protein [Chloroflexia bacterium]
MITVAKPGVRVAFEAVVLFLCLLSFVQAADSNYRSAEGLLGQTVPPSQEEIVTGIAPAPYVYRQGVPQLRAVLTHFTQQGHAALFVDTGFALIAMLAGAYLARSTIGRELVVLGIFVSTLACVTAYPNDKPEAVAAVAAVTTMSSLIIARRYAFASIIAVSSMLLRPEVPVVLGITMVVAWLVMKNAIVTERRVFVYFLAVALLGILYLLLARFIFWPDAHYPQGVPVFMLGRNLTRALAFPGVLLGLSFIGVGASWIVQSFSKRNAIENGDSSILVAVVGLGLFICLYSALVLLVAQAEEIRIYQPIVPVLSIVSISFFVRDYRSKPNPISSSGQLL